MQYLYHSSPKKQLTEIQPRRTLSGDAYIGDFVFATSDPRLAAMYLATKGNAILLNVKTKKPRIVICNNPINYLLKDMGGAIYNIPISTFRKSPQKGLEDSEMVSEVAVIPIEKQVYARSIDAMKDMGVSVYFVNEKMFNKIVQNKEEDKIIAELRPFFD